MTGKKEGAVCGRPIPCITTQLDPSSKYMITDSNTSDNTPTRFSDVAAAMIELGYLITPIAPGKKNPVIPGWTKHPFSADNPPKGYARHGVGILCGQGKYPLAGIDLDILLEALADRTRQRVYDLIGVLPERVGKAPKMLFPCRTDKPLPKITSRTFVDADGKTSRLEILGNGQQFVAFGIHPDTKEPYQWSAPLGNDPLQEHISNLPVVTQEQLEELIRLFEEDALALGLKLLAGSTGAAAIVDADDPFANHTPRSDLTLEEARELLQYLDCDAPYDNGWIDVGMALHFEFHGSEEALDLWDEWSRAGTKYENRADLEYHWGTFKHQGGNLKTAIWLRSTAQKCCERKNKRRPDTEMGNMHRLLDRFGEDLMYVPGLKAWYCWNNGLWRCREEDIPDLAQMTIEDLPLEISKIADRKLQAKFVKFCERSQGAVMVDHMVKLAKSSPRTFKTKAESLDARLGLLGTPNGVLDLKKGVILPHDKNHLVTLTTSVEFNLDATCPLWEQTVLEVFGGDEEMVDFCQQLMGFLLLGTPEREKLLVIAHGKGANGKSTILNTLYRVLGEYSKEAAIGLLLSDGKNKVRDTGALPEILALLGKRFVLVNETDSDTFLREGIVKTLTGGESMPARAMRSDKMVSVKPTWVNILQTNNPPNIPGVDKGIWRRILVLPFLEDFSREGMVMDMDREERLKAEYPGIFAWVVRGTLKYLACGALKFPKRVQEAKKEYMERVDIIGEWKAECLEFTPDGEATSTNLKISLKSYLDRNGEGKYMLNNPRLRRLLEAIPGVKYSNHIKNEGSPGGQTRGYKGVRIRATGDFE